MSALQPESVDGDGSHVPLEAIQKTGNSVAAICQPQVLQDESATRQEKPTSPTSTMNQLLQS